MNWSERIRWREEIHDRYPDLWDLRLIRKGISHALGYLRDGERVLDVGAFNRHMEEKVKKRYPRAVYRSLDIDPSYPHDFSSFEEVHETFDVVFLFEVIEHLGVEEGREMVEHLYRILNRGGRVLLSTPNLFKPGQYWRDITHVTSYHYEELGALFLARGFEILDFCRITRGSFLKFCLREYLLSPLFKLLEIDFAESILLVAQKG